MYYKGSLGFVFLHFVVVDLGYGIIQRGFCGLLQLKMPKKTSGAH